MTGLWEFYLNTVVEVVLHDGRTLRIKQVPDIGGDDWPFDRDYDAAWILTACNPRSEPLADDVNSERHRALGDQLSTLGYPFLQTVGFDPDDDGTQWSEPGYAVLGIPADQLISLARSWEQNAVYKWSPDHWDLIGVLMEGQTRVGWRYL